MKSVPVKLFSSSSTLSEPGADLAQIRRQKMHPGQWRLSSTSGKCPEFSPKAPG